MPVCCDTDAAIDMCSPEGLALTCGNDAESGSSPVQLSQHLHSHHPFGESPERHPNIF